METKSNLYQDSVAPKIISVIEFLKYWWLIPCRFVAVLVFIAGLAIGALGSVVPASVAPLFNVVGAGGMFLSLVIGALSLLAPFALIAERGRLPKGNGWYPSGFYYLMLFPTGLVGFILSIVYTRRRLQHYGNDDFATRD